MNPELDSEDHRVLADNWVYNGDTQEQWGSHLFPVAWRGRMAGVQGWRGKRQRQEAEEAQVPAPGLREPLGSRRHPWILKLHFLFLFKLTWMCFCYFQPKRINQHSFLECGSHWPEPNLTARTKLGGARDPMCEGSWPSRSSGRKGRPRPHWV